MKKKKQKPDFSKPKPQKIDLEEAVVEEIKKEQKEKDTLESHRKKTQQFYSEKSYYNLPLIVIAGRPNVGKSTLFNALTKTHRAITDPTPGVTRDPVESVALIAGKPVRLVDTGGYKLERIIGSKEAELDEAYEFGKKIV